LSDFGLVKSLQDNATNRIITKERAYSLVWASPEQLNPHSIVSFSTDIYSFGIVVWEVLNHQQPWEGFKDLQMMFATVSGRFKDYHSFSSRDFSRNYENVSLLLVVVSSGTALC